MLSLLPLFVLGNLPPAPSTWQNSIALITYHGNAETIEKAVQAIATQAHLSLGVATALKGDIVAVNVTNVPANEVLTKLAEVEYSGWNKSGDSLFLTPDSSKVEKAKESYYASRIKEIQASMNRLNGVPAFVPAQDNSDNLMGGAMQAYGVGGTTSPIVVESIGADTIARMRPGDRIVYSSAPNSLQRQLPNAAQEEFDKEIAKGEIKNASKVDLVLSYTEGQFAMGITLNAEVYDHSGKIISTQSSEIPTDDSFLSRLAGAMPSAEKPSAPKPPEKPITITGPAAVLLERSKQNGPNGMNYVPSAAYLDAVSNPVQFDPLMLDAAYITGLGDAHSQNVIASLPDSLFSQFGSSPSILPSAELEQLKTNNELVVNNSDKWLTVQESNPETAHQDRTDRVFLAEIIKFAKANSTPDVGALSKIAVECHGVLSNIDSTYAELAQPAWALSFLTQNWHLLELYGTLSDIERSSINNGQSISLSSLSPGTTAVVNKLVYGADCKLNLINDPNKSKASNPLMDLGEAFMPGGMGNTSDYRGEPTEIAPNGLPPAGVLTGKISTSAVYTLSVDAKKGTAMDMINKMPFNESQIAMMLAMANDPQMQGVGMPKINGLKPGERTSLNIRIIIAPNVYAGGTISQDDLPSDAAVISPDNYPKGVTDKIAQMKDMFKKYMPANAGGGTGAP